MTDFGERVDLTANLASILRRYPFSVGLFREVIQNSDDGKAAKQIFILDRRTYNGGSLLRPSLANLQGPALLACNDGVFSEEDWDAIRNVSQSSKVADTEKIGKHGLGSRAYYHLTDNPQYLSGGHLAIFDPHRWAFEHGGWRETLENIALQYPDQLEPFCKATGEDIGTHYPGTVVRLALRTASVESRISSAKPSADKIHDLLVDFIQQELHLVLLFLSHLTSIEVREIDALGRVRTLASATAHSQPRELSQHSDPSATFSLVNRQVTVVYDASVRPSPAPSPGDWFILRASFPMDECVRDLSNALRDSSEHVRKELDREKLRPEVALAFPGASLQHRPGRLFTYLPLPLETGFPCHIHGVFSLTDARQNLRNPSETILAGTADALAVAWNKLLFSSIIPRAWLGFLEFFLSGGWNKLPSTSIIRRTWLALLESVASDGSSLDLYQMLPPRQDRNTSGDAKYWTTLLRDIVRLARDRNAKIWPIISSTSSQAPTYTALGDALIASEVNNSEQLRVLAKAGIPILLPPPEVSVVLLEISPAQKLTPGTVRPRLVAAPELSAMSRAECNAIVEFLLGDGRLEELADVPVIPLVQCGSVALSERKKGRALYILFSHEDAELFGRFEPQAVAVDDLPPAAGSRLVRQGSSCLNVTTLNYAKVDRYIQAAAAKFPYPSPSRDSWSWAQTCGWLSLFWRWIGDSSFHAELLVGIRSLPLLPTTAGQLCTLNETIFSFSPDWDDLSRVVFSRIGIKFLHSSIPPAFLQRCRPTIIRSIFEPSDLLDALRPISLVTIRVDGDATKTLQEHLSSILHMSVRLTNLQKATLRSLPIHPVLTNQPSLNCLASHPSSIRPEPCKLYCLKSLNSFPLPIIDDAIFAHVTDVERRLLEQIDYSAVAYPLSEQDLLQLHVEHIVKQPPAMHLRVLEHLARNPAPRSLANLDKLRSSPMVRVRDGQYVAPQDVVDPKSSISDIIPPEDPSAIFDDKGENTRIADALATLGLLRREIDPVYLHQRITSFRDKSSLDAARRLLRTLDSTFYNSGVQGIDGFAWLPTKAGLRTSRETRDASQRMLCDRVWELLDIPEPLRSPPLRRMLGWHEPIPIDVLVEQFRALLPEPRSGEIHPYLLELTTEFGRRYHEMSPSQLDQLFDLLHAQEWVPTSDGRLRQPAFAVFESSSTLRGFGQIPLDFAARPGVKEFLGHMGCATRPTNDAILVQLEALRHERRPEDVVHESLALLGVLDPAVLSEQHRARVLVPGVDGILRTTGELFHNDLGSRMHELRLPPSRVRVHQQIHRPLCTALGIPSLGSLHLEPLELDSEDMREDLTTRIRNVLRAYHVEQAFNEYLANAADAGASRFSIMLDSDEEQKRRASPGTVLCESMATLCCRPALVVHNNAEFTMDDFRGICRIGRGGKQDRDATIGRFGLGALSFYHFTEVAMILSGSHLLLLDPSGRFLPEEVKTNRYILPLDNVRSIYPGHLQVFDDLFGFRVAHNHYKGTIIRLPLRTRLEAMNSASLSNRSFTSDDIHAMLVRYRSDASRSLFFICISEVAALRSGRPAPLWSTCAHRQTMPLAEGEPYNVQRLDIAEVDEPGHCRRSEWVVVSSTVAPDCYHRWNSVIARNRVKNVSVAVAGELVQGSDSRTPQSHLFASLPLPIKTALPVHVHASFILADDRRNIRWDGDGTMTDDSRFNRWLVTAILSPLYILAVERWTIDCPSAVVPWPGNSDITPDPISRAFIDTFYGDPEDGLIGTSRQLLRSMSNDRICPSHAVFRGSEPKAIKKLLVRLRPTDLVELPRPVRAELFRLSPSLARRVDPLFVSRVLADKRDEFTSAYRSGTLTVEDIEHCVKYLMGGDMASSHDRLVGRPLLPLAVEGSLADVQRADDSLVVFAGRWTVRPWPLFPAHRFLHPDLV
ncbi:hypothetical protein OH76DRAFT_1409168 [Lentinus brumalis]|uniref:Sacsin/Nov domain-containing protein n=1 Tax=Lentinus brumalis TaxID=2498619 RepID=A0A371CVJ8_9APHY|nr:hypothetical protein OH76DRAFT_1409168 [Polyporus brumalis]